MVVENGRVCHRAMHWRCEYGASTSNVVPPVCFSLVKKSYQVRMGDIRSDGCLHLKPGRPRGRDPGAIHRKDRRRLDQRDIPTAADASAVHRFRARCMPGCKAWDQLVAQHDRLVHGCFGLCAIHPGEVRSVFSPRGVSLPTSPGARSGSIKADWIGKVSAEELTLMRKMPGAIAVACTFD